jgi:hypothetical protein
MTPGANGSRSGGGRRTGGGRRKRAHPKMRPFRDSGREDAGELVVIERVTRPVASYLALAVAAFLEALVASLEIFCIAALTSADMSLPAAIISSTDSPCARLAISP